MGYRPVYTSILKPVCADLVLLKGNRRTVVPISVGSKIINLFNSDFQLYYISFGNVCCAFMHATTGFIQQAKNKEFFWQYRNHSSLHTAAAPSQAVGFSTSDTRRRRRIMCVGTDPVPPPLSLRE